MIKVNLLPVKRKKKPKPLPSFLIGTIAITIFAVVVLAYLFFFFNSRLSDKKAQFKANEQKIAELKEKIKAVEDFEKKNKVYKEKNEIIEQLSKNKAMPVKLLDELSALLPKGVWLNSMTVKDQTVNIGGIGFTNTEIVSYIDRIKASQMFTEVYLMESKSTEIEKIQLYSFKISFKIKA